MTDEGLTPGRHPEYAELGPLVLRYLITGNDEGHPELDDTYADAVGVSVPVARAKANEASAACDGAIDAELPTKTREAQEQREREQWAAGLAQARAYCTERGGRYGVVQGAARRRRPGPQRPVARARSEHRKAALPQHHG
jgi:hypothetical protein